MINAQALPLRKNVFPLREKQTPVEWLQSDSLVEYPLAVRWMEQRVAAIQQGQAPECVWLLEHPPLYTAGTSAKENDLIEPASYPVFKTGRGGQYTYHGPGQRVAYVMLDLKKREADVRKFVSALECWILETLAAFNISAKVNKDRIGVWVERPEKPRLLSGALMEDKIAALGIRLRKWVSYHGVSLNIDPDLSHFNGIVPCGIRDFGVTSFEDLGFLVTKNDVDLALRSTFEEIFGATVEGQWQVP